LLALYAGKYPDNKPDPQLQIKNAQTSKAKGSRILSATITQEIKVPYSNSQKTFQKFLLAHKSVMAFKIGTAGGSSKE